MELRPLQFTVVDECLKYLEGDYNKPVVATCPTAFGKSLCISKVAQEWGEPCLVLQPNKELLEQNLEKLRIFGGDATVYSASAGTKELSEFTYATLGSVKKLAKEMRKMGIRTVLVDEAHKECSPDKGSEFVTFMEELAPKKVIGFTATPFRLKAYMGGAKLMMLHRTRPSYFKKMLLVVQIQEMLDNDYWTPIKYYQHDFDTRGLDYNSNGSKFTKASVEEVVSSQKINETMHDMTVKLLEQDKHHGIMLFIDSVANAIKMQKLFGDKAVVVHAKTPKKERAESVRRFKANEVPIMCNVGVFTTGFDYPELTHIIMGYPTNSLSSYYQIIGRITRKSEGKRKAFFIDLCGNVERFGRIEDLEIISYPGEGWGVFSGNKLLTNKYLGTVDKTKDDIKADLNGKVTAVDKWPWGKFKGRALSEAPISYIKFMLYRSGFDWNSPSQYKLKKKLESLINT